MTWKFEALIFERGSRSLQSLLAMQWLPAPRLPASHAGSDWDRLQTAKQTYQRLLTRWEKRKAVLDHNALAAAHFSEWFWRLSNGRRAGPLISCVHGESSLSNTPVWNHQGSGAYGWLQYMRGTYQSHANRSRGWISEHFGHFVTGLVAPDPNPGRGWGRPLDHFMAGGWAFSQTSRSDWVGDSRCTDS